MRFRRKLKVDRELARRIYESTEEIPRVGVNFGAFEGELFSICLGWGTSIPMYFPLRRKTVLLTSACGIRREELIRFGEIPGR